MWAGAGGLRWGQESWAWDGVWGETFPDRELVSAPGIRPSRAVVGQAQYHASARRGLEPPSVGLLGRILAAPEGATNR